MGIWVVAMVVQTYKEGKIQGSAAGGSRISLL
jgi:hypothetical protein